MEIGTGESDYIFYADESGDHSLTSIDLNYPVFVLSLCAFKKQSYCSRVVPSFQRLKFKYFGHDAVVLHEHDIRKQNVDFRILTDKIVRESFISDLSKCLAKSPFRLFSTVIFKPDLRFELFPENPYMISLRICLQQAYHFLNRKGQLGLRTHFIFEKRGKTEDSQLELEFHRIVAGQNDLGVAFDGFSIHFVDKRTNSTGMQVADLTARPIGLSVFRTDQANRAFNLIETKIYRIRRYAKPSRGILIP